MHYEGRWRGKNKKRGGGEIKLKLKEKERRNDGLYRAQNKKIAGSLQRKDKKGQRHKLKEEK